MTFEEIEVEATKHIILNLGDGAFKSFPADEANPEFVAWLETEDGKTYSKATK